MSRLRNSKDRGKLRIPAVICIAIILVCLSMRLLTLSLSDEIGQADHNLGSLIMSKLCINVMESGASLIGYHSEEKESKDFLMRLLTQEYALYEFTKENRSLEALLNNSGRYQTGDEARNIAEGSATVDTEQKSTEKHPIGGIGFRDITEGKVSKEYILTNGAAFDRNSFQNLVSAGIKSDNTTYAQMPVGVLEGEIYFEESEATFAGGEGSAMEAMRSSIGNTFTMEQLKNINFLISNFYIVDGDTKVMDSLFDAEVMLGKDMSIKQGNDEPQILIYHTHSQEAFIDSRTGVSDDTVVGVGTYLAKILEEDYGYHVIHDTSIYDMMGGRLNRNKAYNYAEDGVLKILEENPTIEVLIDLHRDAGGKRSTMLDGKETAQIMLFNGLSRNLSGPREDLENPNLQDNLAFSLQLQLKSLEKYPGLFYRNYLKSYRYNLHLRPKSILVELGTEENTLESAMNAMEPLADVLDEVLQGGS